MKSQHCSIDRFELQKEYCNSFKFIKALISSFCKTLDKIFQKYKHKFANKSEPHRACDLLTFSATKLLEITKVNLSPLFTFDRNSKNNYNHANIHLLVVIKCFKSLDPNVKG